MGQFKPMVKMETTEPSVILKLKKGGPVKKATGGVMMSPAPAAAPMPDARNMAKRAMMQKAMQKKRPGAPMMAADTAGAAMPPAMKEGGKADMAQDKAMIKKAMKQHDRQEHKGGKGTELTLKKGGRMAC